MPEPIDLNAAFRMPSRDAVAYFEAKGYQPTLDWWEMDRAAHARAFTVAHAARQEVLESIRGELQRMLDDGITEREFVERLTGKLQRQGWWGKQVVVDAAGGAKEVQLGSPWRLKNIYRVNKQVAYNVGRYKQQMENSDQRPWWRYVAVMDSRTRPSHAALNGRVFRYDDPIWDDFYPPNGWGCRCRVRALSDAALKRRGLRYESSDGDLSRIQQRYATDPRTGEVITRPGTAWHYRDGGKDKQFAPDPGWSYNPGRAGYDIDVDLMRKITAVQDRSLRTQAVQAFNNNAVRHQAFSLWVDRVLDDPRPGHGAQVVGLVSDDVADAIAARSGQPPARVLVMEGGRVNAGSPLTRVQYAGLSRAMSRPLAVLWDTVRRNVLYVLDDPGDRTTKIVIRAPAGGQGRAALDVAIDTERVLESELRNADRYEPLVGWRR